MREDDVKKDNTHASDDVKESFAGRTEGVFTAEDFEDDSPEMNKELFKEEKYSQKKKQKKMRRRRHRRDFRKQWIIAGTCVAVLLAIYFGISIFFMNHFFINTEINGHDFSAKKVSDVEKYIKEQVRNYSLEILEKDGKTDIIKGEDISLNYQKNGDIEKALKKQNAFLWPKALFSKKTESVTIGVSYDEEALNEKIKNLQAVTTEQIPAENAKPQYDGEQYVIQPEAYGTAVDMDTLNEKIHEYISKFQNQMDMEEEKCYAVPEFTTDSPEVKAACETMNKYITASITYPMQEQVVVDKNLISQWLTVDDDMNVTFNMKAMQEWFTEFGDKYDTVGITRTFTTPAGKSTTVTGGTYGWSIDEETELTNLINSIQNSEVVTREPAYYFGGTAAEHKIPDWGDTYIDVDLSAQHMWYVEKGSVVLETDVVTGKPDPDRVTPEGVYSILNKKRDEVLVGEIVPETGEPEYRTPVSYWMPITWSGVGFHDATWQAAFGGNLYETGAGSHGCINMPLDQAAALYDMISVGTPVVVHY